MKGGKSSFQNILNPIKESDIRMLELEENLKLLQELKEKLKSIGESL